MKKIIGWYYYPPTKKWHYFKEGISLCGWWFEFLKSKDLRPLSHLSPSQGDSACTVCYRAFLKDAK